MCKHQLLERGTNQWLKHFRQHILQIHTLRLNPLTVSLRRFPQFCTSLYFHYPLLQDYKYPFRPMPCRCHDVLRLICPHMKSFFYGGQSGHHMCSACVYVKIMLIQRRKNLVILHRIFFPLLENKVAFLLLGCVCKSVVIVCN